MVNLFSKKGRSLLFIFSIIIMCGSVFAQDNATESQTIDFENGATMKPYATNGCKAEAKLSNVVVKSGTNSLQLDYSLKPTKNDYVAFWKDVNVPETPTELSFDLYGDESNNILFIRLVDAKGETFQYKRALISWKGWENLVIDLPKAKYGSWGKNKDGKIDPPVKSIAIELRSYNPWGKSKDSGTLYIDNIKFVYNKPENTTSTKVNNNTKILTGIRNDSIIIDGKLDEWQKKNSILLSKSTCQLPEGEIANDSESSAKVYLNYDDKYLYVAAEIKDKNIVGPYEGYSIWQNDGIELWLDCDLEAQTIEKQNESFFQIGLTYTTASGKPGVMVWRNNKNAYIIMATKIATSKTDDGYILEAAIPKDAFPVKFNDDSIIGFDVSLVNSGNSKFSHLFWAGRKDGDKTNYGAMVFKDVDESTIKDKFNKRDLLRKAVAQKNNSGNTNYQGSPVFRNVASVSSYKKYECAEFKLDLNAEYKNPFDYDDITVQGKFHLPDGKSVIVDAFYTQDYQIDTITRKDGKISGIGSPYWKVRFTPISTGKYKAEFTIKDSKGRVVTSDPISFDVSESSSNGFIRTSSSDKQYLTFDTGNPFFSIGFGAHFWNYRDVLLLHKYFLNKLAAFGGNTISFNLQAGSGGPFDLETNRLGFYDLVNAAKFDYILNAAALRNIYVLPCLNQTKLADLKHWPSSIYNSKNGGPCNNVDEFFENPEVTKSIKQRLRYTIARWGYSPNIIGWEIFNEVTYLAGFIKNREQVVSWHDSIAKYIKSLDPNNHLISTSFGSGGDSSEYMPMYTLPSLDFVIIHLYSNDITTSLRQRMASVLKIGKPVFGGEIGMPCPAAASAIKYDPEGISYHNAVWTSAMTKAAGNVLHWWENFHEVLDLDYHSRAFQKFSSDIDWPKEGFIPVSLTIDMVNPDNTLMDLDIPVSIAWGDFPSKYVIKRNQIMTHIVNKNAEKAETEAEKIRLKNDGGEAEISVNSIPGIIYGKTATKGSKNKVEFEVKDISKNTKLLITFSATGALGATGNIIFDDGKTKPFSLSDKDGKDDPYATEFEETIEIPISAGNSKVTIENTGDDWCSLKKIVIRDYLSTRDTQNVSVFGLSGKQKHLIWFHNNLNTWYQRSIGNNPKNIAGIYANLPVENNGEYQIQWWDTYRGEIISSKKQISKDRSLKLLPPVFDKDIACKILYNESVLK